MQTGGSIRQKILCLGVLTLVIFPGILFIPFYHLLGTERLMDFFSTFGWGNSDFYVFVFYDMIVTFLCLFCARLLSPHLPALKLHRNRQLLVFTSFVIVAQIYTSLYTFAILMLGKSIPRFIWFLFSPTVFFTVLFLISVMWVHRVFPPGKSVHKHLVVFLLLLTIYLLILLAAFKNIASLRETESYYYWCSPSVNPIEIISFFFAFLAEKLMGNILHPDAMWELQSFLHHTFQYCLLAGFSLFYFGAAHTHKADRAGVPNNPAGTRET